MTNEQVYNKFFISRHEVVYNRNDITILQSQFLNKFFFKRK